MSRQVLARRVEDLDLERAEAHDHLSARVRPVRGITMPSLERDHAVPVGLHMPPRDHVETLPGQRQQRRTVLGEQATFLRVVYGQINVYDVTIKSERHKRSYWTRTADGNSIGGRKAPVPYGS